MKSFSQFNNLIEARGEEVIPSNVEKGERLLKKISKKLKQTVPTKDADPWDNPNFAEIERDARGKKGEEIRKTVEKSSKNIDKGQNDLLNKVNDKSGNRPPDVKKGELGRLYKTGTDEYGSRQGSTRTNAKINQELQSKRTARINPTTGKATQKGVENFAINKLTKGLSTKGVTGREQLDNARKLASNPNSAAYKDIENKINTSDYAGKRASLATTKELDKIKTEIKTSKTIDAKVDTGKTSIAPTNIKTKTNKTSLNTSTRRGRITPLLGKTTTPTTTNIPIDTKADELLDNIKNRPETKTLNKEMGQKQILDKINQQDKNILKPTKKGTLGGFKTNRGGLVTVNTRVQSSTPTPTNSKVTFGDFKNKIASKVPVTTSKTNLLSKVKGAKFYPYARGLSGLGQKTLGVLGAGLQYKGNYDAAKGSNLRKHVKAATQTASSIAGFTGGAAIGTGLGSFTGPGAFVTGTVSGLATSDLTHKASGKLFDKIWKPPTTNTKTKETKVNDKKILTPPVGNSNNKRGGRVGGVHRGISI
tara:strand:- start:1082 stop:2683 length:1602 start_codon:yes stop_codon:yes gene_type:complete